MGYGSTMSGGSSRPSDVPIEEWRKEMNQQDEDFHNLFIFYAKGIGIITIIVLIAITIAEMIW